MKPSPAPARRRLILVALPLAALALAALAAALYARRLQGIQVPRAEAIAEHLRSVFEVYVSEVAGPASAWRSIAELEWTATAVGRVADTLGGPPEFKTTMAGPVRMARVPVPELRAFAPPVGQGVLGDIVLTDYNFDHGQKYAIYLIVHEIGHVLDWRSHKHLSQAVSAETGARRCDPDNPSIGCVFDAGRAVEPPPGNPDEPYAAVSSEEYWAEVFASTVYPDYYQQSAANNPIGPQTEQVVKTKLMGMRAE
jgi:hypothetical protein